MMSYLWWRICVVILYASSSFFHLVFANDAANDVNPEGEEVEEERTGTIIGIDLGTTYSEYYYNTCNWLICTVYKFNMICLTYILCTSILCPKFHL